VGPLLRVELKVLQSGLSGAWGMSVDKVVVRCDLVFTLTLSCPENQSGVKTTKPKYIMPYTSGIWLQPVLSNLLLEANGWGHPPLPCLPLGLIWV
jgi:hypothetical protein